MGDVSRSPATYFTYVAPPQPFVAVPGQPIQYAAPNIQPDPTFPFPNATSSSGASAVDQTFRSIVNPDLWGDTIRIRFDLGALRTTDSIIAGTRDVVSRLHAAGLQVLGGTLTSALGVYGVPCPTVDNGPVAEAGRQILNDFIRHSGIFDGVVEFDLVTLDPATGNMKAAYLPNSQFTLLPWDYLHPNHAGYNAMGEVVDLAPFDPGRRRGRDRR